MRTARTCPINVDIAACPAQEHYPILARAGAGLKQDIGELHKTRTTPIYILMPSLPLFFRGCMLLGEKNAALSEKGHSAEVVGLAGHSIIKTHLPCLQPSFLKLVLGLRFYANIAFSSWDKVSLTPRGHISRRRRSAMSLYVAHLFKNCPADIPRH